jgi:Carboxypeptidase regulatory-like domain/TonB-dependent Receptor Plug Domain
MKADARLVFALGVVLLLAGGALAQTNVGRISGAVTDASGATVPGATVTATDTRTSLQQTAVTDERGLYVFASLPAGTYDLRAEAVGFRTSERLGVVLDAASRRAIDFGLELGARADTISVSAAVEQVQSNSGNVGRVITEQQLSQIALNGREYIQLLRLVPGVVATSLNVFNPRLDLTQQRVNGIRTNSVYFTIDGAENHDNGANSNAIVDPNMDALAEIKIETSSYSAEFGGRAGAMVNLVTKSGGRDFHGSLFEFVRNDVFDARSFFAPSVEPLRFNNFGWTIGGPVFIPGKFNTQRDKLFFFYSEEWKFVRQGQANVNVVPTAEERSGDFVNSTLPAPVDPLTGQPFANRVVPQSRWSKNGPLLLQPYPLPNFAGPGGNFVASGMNITDYRQELARIDYRLTPSTQLSYRIINDKWDIVFPFRTTNLGIIPNARPRPGYVTSFDIQHSFSPRTLNFFTVNLSKNSIRGRPDNSVMSRPTLGLTYPEIFPANRSNVGPEVRIAGFTAYNSGDRIRNGNGTGQVRDDFSQVLGAHTLKFGAQITRARKNENTNQRDEGSINFATSAANSTRNVIADALLGTFQNYTEVETDATWWARFSQYEFYAQDSWRVSKRLSLEFGLRYNVIGQIINAQGNSSTFLTRLFDPAKAPGINPSDGSIVAGTGDPWNGIAIFGDSFPDAAEGRLPQADDPSIQRLFVGLPDGGSKENWNDWGPRFGLAYDVFGDGKTAVRGGFGIFYDRLGSNVLTGQASNPPFVRVANVFDGNIDNPAGGTAREFPSDLTFWPERLPTPSVTSYNVGVQHELPRSIIVEVNYVGNVSRHFPFTLNVNQLREGTRLNAPNSTINVNALRPFLGYANINLRDHSDNTSYNSLQIAASRRVWSGLAFGANYTFSKAMENTGGGTPQDTYNIKADRSLAGIHRAHILTFHYIYPLPVFVNSPSRLLRHSLGGWELSGITSFQSGAPTTVTVPTDVARIGTSSSRATLAGDPDLPGDQRTPARWFNTEAFLAPERMTQGLFGNSGRNILIGPGFQSWDLSLFKNVALGEKARLQFRAEAFNVFNHTNFTGINTTVRFDSAGRPTGGYGAVNAAGPGRVLSFGLKFLF